VLLAGILCLLACCTTLSLVERARLSGGRSRNFWIAGAGFIAGSGIWATHFVAMLAYRPGFSFSFDVTLTVVSILIAIVLCTVGFALAVAGRAAAFGGAVAGSAIGIMHYVGTAALRAPENISWEPRIVAASLVLGVLITTLAVVLALHGRGLRSYFASTFCLALAIGVTHFTGMTAVHLAYNPSIPAAVDVLGPATIAVAVAAVTVLILGMGMAMAIVDNRRARQAQRESAILREYVAKLEAAKAELEQSLEDRAVALGAVAKANKTKSDFLSAMSHELRTPLNAIIGFSEMMTTQAFGPLGDRHYVGYAVDIHESGKHLLSLINDVLDLSKLDAGKAQLFEEKIQVGALVSDCLRMMEKQAASAEVTLSKDVPRDLPCVLADERRTKQVLINLLANAVKFTPAGGSVTVTVRVQPGGMTISVADTGIGIEPDSIAKAFENFGQINSTVARKHQGTGLGLPLAKQLMELHGGTLTLNSVAGSGTTVTALLPSVRVLARVRAAAC